MSSQDSPKMYFLLNSDLKCDKGKFAVQVGHAVRNICESYYTCNHKSSKIWDE